jgi:hypothetical protein
MDRRKDNYCHRSRGKPIKTFKDELTEAIIEGKDIDYNYDGEEEYSVDIFNEDEAVRQVLILLKRRGLLKYL